MAVDFNSKSALCGCNLILYKIGKEGGGGCACLWPWLNDLVQVLAKELSHEIFAE